MFPWLLPPMADPPPDLLLVNGHVVTMTLIAVEISRSRNHSAVIFVRISVSNTAPAPLTARPATARGNVELVAVTRPPSVMRASAHSVIGRLPRRCPSIPPVSAMTAPGRK